MEEVTIFDKIVGGEIPAKVVHDDEHVLAFHDINPQAPIHVLVIPKKKTKSVAQFKDLTTEEVGHFMQGVSQVADKLGLADDGFRVVFNTGRDGQQTVDYVHAHILGGRRMQWPPG